MGNDIILNFEEMDLSLELKRGLAKLNFTTPTPVQAEAIAPMLEGKDLLVQAPTGTGKTAAFGIPMIENIDIANRHIQAVVLCPTRELAVQTTTVLKQLLVFKQNIRVMALYGGEPIHHQVTALKRRPQIIVATPGRLLDHMKRRTTRLNQVQCVVLDEADRMLDMGFRDDITSILQSLPPERQTVLFSATVSSEIRAIASSYQEEAVQIQIQHEVAHREKILQYYAEMPRTSKMAALLHLLQEQNFSRVVVFVATKSMADQLSKDLTEAGHLADAIHGDLHQRLRNKVMQRYRTGKISVLVATDVAARGIDVDGIDAVVNYDIPNEVDNYVHRIGRTGRADQSGVAYTLIDARERGKLQNIIRTAKVSITAAPELFGGHAKTVEPENKKKKANGDKPVKQKRYRHARSHSRQGSKSGASQGAKTGGRQANKQGARKN